MPIFMYLCLFFTQIKNTINVEGGINTTTIHIFCFKKDSKPDIQKALYPFLDTLPNSPPASHEAIALQDYQHHQCEIHNEQAHPPIRPEVGVLSPRLADC
jgi:hypothetical protein